MTRIKQVVVFSILALTSLAAHRANADIAPNPLSGGRPVVPFGHEAADVRMVAEDVVVRIYPDSIVTVAVFSMLNEGKDTDMTVGFPFAYTDDVLRFHAFVNNRPFKTRDEHVEHSNPERRKNWTVYWKTWDMTFPSGKPREIRVEYKTKPLESSFFRRYDPKLKSLPADTRDTLQIASTECRVEYVLETGKAWSGVLDRCRVTFELVGMSSDHITNFQTEEGVLTNNSVVWEYTDYEPHGWLAVDYTPTLPVKRAVEVLRGIANANTDNARLYSDVARCIQGLAFDADVDLEMYHAYLARWNSPVPQLIEYASGGRCRVNYDLSGDFFAIMHMASVLFQRYQDTGELEKVRDVAPTASMIATAVIDSIAICDHPSTQWLERQATTLRDICSKLLNSK